MILIMLLLELSLVNYLSPGSCVESRLPVAVLEVDLDLGPGQEILVDLGLVVPDGPPQAVTRPAVDVDSLLDGEEEQHHVPGLAGQQEVLLETGGQTCSHGVGELLVRLDEHGDALHRDFCY